GRLLESSLAEWRDVRLSELHFRHDDVAQLAIVLLVALSLAMVMIRSTIFRRRPQHRVGLPAFVALERSFSWSKVRYLPLLLVMTGLPWFIVALADPYSAFTQRDETFPGRRICLMLDASSSMVRPFIAPTLRGGRAEATFLTTVAAADRFVQ